jgi:hypothetical protein
LTFHPDVTIESKAAVVEIEEGTEEKDVDIRLGKRAITFTVSGRVIEAESGDPVASLGIELTRTQIDVGSTYIRTMMMSLRTDIEGKFKLEGVVPGTYMVSAEAVDTQSLFYSNSVEFVIIENNVTGLEIKVQRGATISGIVVFESSVGQPVLEKLQLLYITAFLQSNVSGSQPSYRARIDQNGTFRITGLQSGKFFFLLSGSPPVKGIYLTGIEHNGIDIRNGIEVTAGSETSSVRVFVSHGTGVVRGQLQFEGGTPPSDVRCSFTANRSSGGSNFLRPVYGTVDSRGAFVIEGLPPGTYDITVRSGTPNLKFRPITQSVTVSNDTETKLTITIPANPGGNRE